MDQGKFFGTEDGKNVRLSDGRYFMWYQYNVVEAKKRQLGWSDTLVKSMLDKSMFI